jgi:hypothetical protein
MILGVLTTVEADRQELIHLIGPSVPLFVPYDQQYSEEGPVHITLVGWHLTRPTFRGLIQFLYHSGLFVIVFSQIGPFWIFLGHLEGDLTPKRGQIFVGSWAFINNPKNYINEALCACEGTFVFQGM